MKYAYLTPAAYDKPMLPDVVTVKWQKVSGSGISVFVKSGTKSMIPTIERNC